jgi:hypothetical protein
MEDILQRNMDKYKKYLIQWHSIHLQNFYSLFWALLITFLLLEDY